eukprot:Amastigsp_a512428_3.p2 type:complete len:102 gc:universal Amastigsp_a512428_3:132-437(+)
MSTDAALSAWRCWSGDEEPLAVGRLEPRRAEATLRCSAHWSRGQSLVLIASSLQRACEWASPLVGLRAWGRRGGLCAWPLELANRSAFTFLPRGRRWWLMG